MFGFKLALASYFRYGQCLSLLILGFVCTAYGKTPDSEQLAQQLTGIKTMEASFLQKTIDRKGDRVLQENRGKMLFKKPDLFRWSVETPIKQLIVSNGSKLWVYDIDLEQVSVQQLQKGKNDKPAMVLLSDPKLLNQQFTVKTFKDRDPGLWFELIPRTNESQFKKMALYFYKNQLTKLQFEDAAGQWSHIELSHIKINLPVGSKSFQFTPPRGVDVVGMEQPVVNKQ